MHLPSPPRAQAALALVCLFFASTANAGPYADALARCMNDRMSDADRVVMMKWMYGALGAHPQVQELATIDAAKFTPVSRAMGALVRRLIVQDCRSEGAAAVKNEGMGSIELAFSSVGQFAARGLFAEPAVLERVADYTKHIDVSELTRALLGGASAPGAAAPAAPATENTPAPPTSR